MNSNESYEDKEIIATFNIVRFFPKPKRFGCFVAAVLLILSPKELICDKKRGSKICLSQPLIPVLLSHYDF